MPESQPGAEPGRDALPEHSRGGALDDPQRSAPPTTPPRERTTAPGDRARLEALLDGVPLPATKRDLTTHARHYGDAATAALLEGIPDRRYATIDEVGEELEPVQPEWPRARRVPRPESDLPPGGAAYGA